MSHTDDIPINATSLIWTQIIIYCALLCDVFQREDFLNFETLSAEPHKLVIVMFIIKLHSGDFTFKYLNNTGCAKSTGAVHEVVQWNLLFLFRDQTLIYVRRTEATWGIEKDALK